MNSELSNTGTTMNEFEKIMIENSAQFLNQEPPEGHLIRFEQKLTRKKKKAAIIHLSKRISRIAAVGLLAIMSSLWAYNEFIQPDQNSIKLGDVNQEYQEVEFFFTSQIDSRYQDIQDSPFIEDEEYKSSLLEEINNMDVVYENLQKELGDNPDDERIIGAMIRHYQTKLQIMTNILDRLQQIQELNNPQINKQNQYESVEL